jgi:hypothetical protein
VDAGRLNDTSIFRNVNMHNQPDSIPTKIEVLQMGLRETDPTIPAVLAHETTDATGGSDLMVGFAHLDRDGPLCDWRGPFGHREVASFAAPALVRRPSGFCTHTSPFGAILTLSAPPSTRESFISP